jgi:hypothetical protein
MLATAFSPDGKLLAGASNAPIALHQVSDGKRVRALTKCGAGFQPATRGRLEACPTSSLSSL